MSDSANLKGNDPVLKCKISVTKDGGKYTVAYDPEKIPVVEYNTDVHFHIDPKSSDDVEIDTVTITPDGQTQLIDQQYTVGRTGFKLKDLNTLQGIFVLHFTYRDKKGNKFSCETAKAICSDEGGPGVDVPQIDNNPPG